MLRTAGFFLTLGLLVATSSAAFELTQVRGKFDCPDLQNQQLCAERFERSFLRVHPGLVRRSNAGARITLSDGRSFALRSDGDPNFLELSRDGAFLIIREQYGEGESWHILDRRRGKLTEIHGYPLFSPNGMQFVAASEDLDAGYSKTVFDVYRVTSDGIARVFRAIPNGAPWAARDVAWDGDARIHFQRTTLGRNGFILRPSALVQRNGQWSLAR